MSFYNLDGTVVEIKGPEDLYFHDVLRIPNWPTRQAASSHFYHLNAAQSAGVTASGIAIGAASGAVNVTSAGGSGGANRGEAAAKGAQNVGHAISGVTDFLTRLTDPHTWLRVAEFLVGAAFLVIGLNHLLGNPAGKLAGATPAGRAVKAARL